MNQVYNDQFVGLKEIRVHYSIMGLNKVPGLSGKDPVTVPAWGSGLDPIGVEAEEPGREAPKISLVLELG